MEKRKSLIFSILRMSVIPVLLLGIILTIYSQGSVREGMNYEIEKSLSGQAHNLISMYNYIDGGQFEVKDGKVFKGETELTNDYRLLDDIKTDTGYDVTIFVGSKQRLTTVIKKDGNRAIDSEVSAEVANEVLKNGREYFSEKVVEGENEYFGYYVPIENDMGETIGIAFAGRTLESVNSTSKYTFAGNVLLCLFVILLAGFMCMLSAHKIVETIQHIRNFLGKVAAGNFAAKMPELVMERGDELTEVGIYALEMRDSLDSLVNKDPLTGLYNRRALISQLEEREDSNLTLVMSDIDHFKSVNDTYGHDIGDEALKYMASKLAEYTEDKGIVSRWGGEEFLLVLDKDREEIRGSLIEFHKTIPLTDLEGNAPNDRFNITATFGVVEMKSGDDFESRLKIADTLLYYGKEHGRNQVVFEESLR